jgi:hypothetical protein
MENDTETLLSHKPDIVQFIRGKLQSALYGIPIRDFFALYDVDKNGKISASELTIFVREVIRISEQEHPDDDIAAFLRHLDVNGDGELSISELSEFVGEDLFEDATNEKRLGIVLAQMSDTSRGDRDYQESIPVLTAEVLQEKRASMRANAASFFGSASYILPDDSVLSIFTPDGSALNPKQPFNFQKTQNYTVEEDQFLLTEDERRVFQIRRNAPGLGGSDGSFSFLRQQSEVVAAGGQEDNQKRNSVLCHNRRCAMSTWHEFLVLKSPDADLFNILTFGLPYGAGVVRPAVDTVKLLYQMQDISERWAKSKFGSISNLKSSVHVYPTNSVHSFHLHMLDASEAQRNPYNAGMMDMKNMPLSEVIRCFELENPEAAVEAKGLLSREMQQQQQQPREEVADATAEAQQPPASLSPAPSLADDLPLGWTAHVDSSTGKQYYMSLATSETTWTKPVAPLPRPPPATAPPVPQGVFQGTSSSSLASRLAESMKRSPLAKHAPSVEAGTQDPSTEAAPEAPKKPNGECLCRISYKSILTHDWKPCVWVLEASNVLHVFRDKNEYYAFHQNPYLDEASRNFLLRAKIELTGDHR